MPAETTKRIEAVLTAIPKGKVLTYGEAAMLAGIPGGARLVVRILHTRSGTAKLPWHRVIRKNGSIALPHDGGFELQKKLLESEGVKVSDSGIVNTSIYGWHGEECHE